MRTRVIPAQITTVEDKIAGNFSLTQIMILLTPVLFATLIYALMPPSMMFVWYKLGLALVFTITCLILAVRIKGKIVAGWLMVLSRYNLRPKYYVFNKNDTFARRIIRPEPDMKSTANTTDVNKGMNTYTPPSVKDLLRLNHIINDKGFNLSYKIGKKGGLNVAFEKISK